MDSRSASLLGLASAASSPVSACTGPRPSCPPTSPWPWRSAPPAPAPDGNAIDRLGMRFAPLVLRLMGPTQVAKKRRRIDHAGNPDGLTLAALRRAPRRLRRVSAASWDSLLPADSLLFAAAAAGLRLGRADLASGRPSDRRRRHRTHPARLPRRPRRRRQRRTRLPPGAGTGHLRYEGPWADELRITLRQMDIGRQPPPGLRRAAPAQRQRPGGPVRHRAPAGRGTGRARSPTR